MQHFSVFCLLAMSMLFCSWTNVSTAEVDTSSYIDTGLGFKYYQRAYLNNPARPDLPAIDLEDTTTYEFVPGSNKVITLETIFQISGKNPHGEEILAMHFADTLYDAYRTILQEYSLDTMLSNLVEMSQFTQGYARDSKSIGQHIDQAGEYDWMLYNNQGTGKKGHLVVTSQPICDVTIRIPDINYVATMHSQIDVQLLVGSGFPFAERIADYIDRTMLVAVFDADSQKIAEQSLYVNANPDSTRMEYVTSADILIDYINSPQYTIVATGPLLAEPLITKCMVAADTIELVKAIERAKYLSDSIDGMTQFAAIKLNLDSAIAVARPYVQYTAYQQDEIDAAAVALKGVIVDSEAAIQKASALPTMPVSSLPVHKVMKEQQLYIQRDGRTYDVIGR